MCADRRTGINVVRHWGKLDGKVHLLPDLLFSTNGKEVLPFIKDNSTVSQRISETI
jgi:hypothetical protein